MIIMEHYRLGSTRAILSRGFCDQTQSLDKVEEDFVKNMKAFRDFEKAINPNEFESNRKLLAEKVALVVAKIKEARKNAN